jgi:heme-degrading monooxygenase HmoA
MSEGSSHASADADELTVAVINTFTPKAGRLEDFVRLQESALPGFRGRVPGLLGSRFYRAQDGRNAVLISVFASAESFQNFLQSDLFAAHRDRISPLLERTDPGLYQLVYRTGAELPGPVGAT